MTDQEYSDKGSCILSGADFLAPEKKDCFADHRQLLACLVSTRFAPTPLARAAFCEETCARPSARARSNMCCFSRQRLIRLLEQHGFQVYEWLQPADIQARCFAGRDMAAFEHIHYVHAVRQ